MRTVKHRSRRNVILLSMFSLFETGEAFAATLMVYNNNDTGAGSLRQAVLSHHLLGGSNTITFSNAVSGVIPLVSGELVISNDLSIIGPGASQLALSGQLSNRVLSVVAGHVLLSGLTVRDAFVATLPAGSESDGINQRGGGILNLANLSLLDCVITNNTVMGGDGGPTVNAIGGDGGQGQGGGIANSGTLALTRCILAGNSAVGGEGGQPTGAGTAGKGGLACGGCLYNEGVARLTNCTIFGNTASGGLGANHGNAAGGGIYNSAELKVITCTVASNSASGTAFDFGGGIFDNSNSGFIRNTTIAGNHAPFGGGLYSTGADVGNTILAANTGDNSPDGAGTIVSSDYNLVQINLNLTINGTTAHNLIGHNAVLGPLQDNGGPTPTMALLPGSPAIDRGTSFGLTSDQRGRPRPFDFPSRPNASGADASDIGAFEVNPPLLDVARAGSTVLISWPTNDPGYQLEVKTNLEPAAPWFAAPGAPGVVGNQFTLTNSPVGAGFYRLRSP
jgi:hypothetical protein